MKTDDLNKSHDLPNNDYPTPDKAPNFNVCFVSDIDTFRRS